MSQCDRILKHLKDHGSITPIVALNEYNCMRLAARVSDLKSCGHNIATIIVKKNNKRFAKYILSGA